MPIPLSQLETWSHLGAVATSSAAYASIKNALLKASSPLAYRSVDIFLQGSYRNATNIYGDSDIDVVVYYPYSYTRDVSALNPVERQFEQANFLPATYLWSQLRDETLAALRSHYGLNAVTPANKSIKAQTGSGRPSDVVPAIEFRRYVSFASTGQYTAYQGIQLYDAAGTSIINYPKLHIDRGEDKNQATRTAGYYKPTVRVFKNLRNYLVDHYLLAKGVAPSYFIECALHNIPDHLFIAPLNITVPAILAHLWTTPRAALLCQNGIVPLFGGDVTQWSEANYVAFVAAALNAWQNW